MKHLSVLLAILAMPAFATVNVTSPTSGSSASPVHFVANATTTCSSGVSSIGIYTAPYVLAYKVSGSNLNTYLNLSAGTYNTVVQEWDACGSTKTAVTITVSSGGSTTGTIPSSSHVFVVVEENHSYSQVIGSSSMPYLNSLATKYGLATQYYANTHPSIGNYFMMTAGQIITNNDSYCSTLTNDNIVRHLLSAGKTWKSYAQSIPYAGYTGWDVYPYVQHHNPFAYFSDNRNGSGQQNNIVPFSQFGSDVANNALPNFSFVVPDLEHDAHDCPDGGSSCTDNDMLWAADQFLQFQIAPLLNSAQFQKDGLLVIWFDEAFDSDTSYGGGKVAVVLVGPSVKRGFRSSNLYQHQSLLRTISESLGITPVGDATSAPSMAEFFSSSSTTSTSPTPTATSVTLVSPAPGASAPIS